MATIKYADPCWSIDLMAGEDIEVTIQGLDIERQPRCGLTTVDQKLGAVSMRQLDNGLDRDHRAGRVGEVGDRDEPGARRQACGKGGEIEPAGRIDRRHHEAETDPITQQLPRHDVRMMLELADQHLVAGFEKSGPPALRNEVDSFRGVANKDYLARVGGV